MASIGRPSSAAARSTRTYAVPLVVLVLFILALLPIWAALRAREDEAVRLRTHAACEEAARHLQNFVAERIATAELLRRDWIAGRTGSRSEFARQARDRVTLLEGFQAINWVDPDGVIRWVVPEEGNEGALNRNLRDNVEAAATYLAATESGTARLTPPVTLLQGGRGLAAYLPIPSAPDGTPRGVINVVFRTADLVSSGLNPRIAERFSYTIDDDGLPVHAHGPPGQPDDDARHAAEATFKVLDRTWTIRLQPTLDEVAAIGPLTSRWMLGAGIAAAIVIATILHRAMASRDEAIYRSAEMQALVRAYPDTKVRVNRDGLVLEMSTGPESNPTAPPERFVGKHLRDFLAPEAADGLHAAIGDAATHGIGRSTYQAERDGRVVHFESRVVPLRGDEFVMVLRDITTRMQASAILEGRNAVFEMLSGGAPLDAVLDCLVRSTEDAIPGMLASVLLLDPSGRRLRLSAAPSLPAEYNAVVDGIEIGPNVGSCGAAAFSGKRVIAEDILNHPNWAPFRAITEAHGLRACWSEPIKSPDGTVIGTFAMYYRAPRGPLPEELSTIETAAHIAQLAIERGRNLQALREREARLAEAQRAARLGNWQFDARGDMTWSPEVMRALGVRPETEPCYETYLAIVHPDDLETVRSTIDDALERRIPFALDHRLARGDGSERFVHTEGRPEFDDLGVVIRWYGHIQDITERKDTERRLRLMMAELDHRVKNALASVLALTEQSAVTATSLEDFTSTLSGRIRSLASTHAALSATNWSGTELRDLLEIIFDAYLGRGHAPITIEGPRCRIPPTIAPTLSLALHELTTNATKYGALSASGGGIDVRWSVSNDDSGCPRVAIAWTERGGPRIVAQPTPGFGTQLVRGFVEHELRGTVHLDYRSEGLCCRIDLPIDVQPTVLSAASA